MWMAVRGQGRYEWVAVRGQKAGRSGWLLRLLFQVVVD